MTTIYPAANPLALAVSERPRNRAKAYGPGALSDVETLALVIQGLNEAPEAAILAARALIRHFGSVPGLLGKSPAQLRAVGDLSEPIALRVAAALELSRRANMAEEIPALDQASRVFDYMAPRAAGLEVEKVWILCLTRKNRLIRCVELTSGTATACLAHPREVFRVAIAEASSGFVLVHNHPSGDPAPSSPDMQLTRIIREAAKVVDLTFTDHVILGRPGADPLARGFFSFREAGII